jgi:hypothetical protein
VIKKPITLANLERLDLGLLQAEFAQKLKQVAHDLSDRCNDKTKRTVSIAFAFVPVNEVRQGQIYLDSVHMQCEITMKLPKTRTKVYDISINRDNQFIFDDVETDDVHQSTLPLDMKEVSEDD